MRQRSQFNARQAQGLRPPVFDGRRLEFLIRSESFTLLSPFPPVSAQYIGVSFLFRNRASLLNRRKDSSVSVIPFPAGTASGGGPTAWILRPLPADVAICQDLLFELLFFLLNSLLFLSLINPSRFTTNILPLLLFTLRLPSELFHSRSLSSFATPPPHPPQCRPLLQQSTTLISIFQSLISRSHLFFFLKSPHQLFFHVSATDSLDTPPLIRAPSCPWPVVTHPYTSPFA